MTSDRPTLLQALAWGGRALGDRPEDVAVEALGHILSTSEAACATLSDIVDTGDAPVGPIDRVQTQVTGLDGARPDLAAFDQRGRERVLIEAKFGAGLTENQPVAYLERLPEEQPSALLFVVPAARCEFLWAELRRRMSDAGKPRTSFWAELRRLMSERTSGVEPRSFREAGIVWTPAGGARRLMLTSWKALLDRMLAQVVAAADRQAEADVRQLQGLAAHEEEFRPFRNADMHPDFPRRMLGIRRLVDDATMRAQGAGWADTKGLKITPQPWGYGRYLRIAGAQVWFGIDFDDWVHFPPNTPLWLWFTSKSLQRRKTTRDALEPLGKRNPHELFDDGWGGLVVPVALPVEVGYEAVLQAVMTRLWEVAHLLGRRRARRRAPSGGLVGPEEFPPLRDVEMLPDLPWRLLSLRRLVNDATARGLDAGWADTQGLKIAPQPWGYGRYLRLAGAEAWFGIDYEDWARLPPDTPLWLWFRPNSLQRRKTTRSALEPLRRRSPRELFDCDGGGLVVPVPLPVENEYGAVLDGAVQRLEEVARLIGETSNRRRAR